MSYLDDELCKIKSINERLYQELTDTAINYEKYHVIAAKSNDCTVKIVYLDNGVQKEQLVHSKYNPQQEAKKFAGANICEKRTYVIYGFGLGYHVEEMLKLMSRDDILYVVDLDIQLFKLALTLRDSLSNILTDDRLTLIISANEKYVASQIKQVLEDDVAFITYTPSVQTISEEYSYFKFVLEDWKMQQTVTDKWAELLQENYQINKNIDCPNIGILFGEFKDVPMVIVSAGPSLNKNKHFLKYIKGKFLIVAVGSALKPLMAIGVKPDYMCIIDPKPSIYKQFEGYENIDVPLIFLDTASAKAVTLYQGPKYKATKNIKNTSHESYVIDTGGSVATAVLDIGIKFGCNPIIFTGQDLAYTNNEHHADAKMYNPNRSEKIIELPNMRKVMGQNGELLNTTLGLLSYKYWIENKIKDHTEIMFFNATEGGAAIDGAKHSTLMATVEHIYNIRSKRQLPKDRRSDSVIFLLGIGLGVEVVNYLHESAESQIIIIEPDADNVKLACECNNQLEKVLKSENVNLVSGNKVNKLDELIKEYIDIRHQNNIYIVKTYTVNKDRLALFEHIKTIIKNNLHEIDMHVKTINDLADQISENIFSNLTSFIRNKQDVNSLYNAFIGKPAVIVSAGPSLEHNICKLKSIQNKSVIIAGPRTLKPLLENGIIPHLLCNIDPKDSMYNLVKNYDIDDIPLISLIQANHALVRNHNGNKLFAFDEALEPLRSYFSNSKSVKIEPGGSVATFSLCIAELLGCSPIILIGQDLAFSNNKTYAFKSNTEVLPKNIIIGKDANGNDVATRQDWIYFKKNIEEHIAENKNTYINPTEYGLFINGTVNMSLEEAIMRYCKVDFNVKIIFENIFDKKNNIRNLDVKNQINGILAKVIKCKKLIKENFTLSENIYKYIKRNIIIDIEEVLNKMDANDKLMEDNALVSAFMHYPIQKDYLNITLNYSPQNDESVDEEQLRIANKNIELYKAKLKAIEYVEGKLETIYKEVAKNGNHVPETEVNS